MNRKLVTSGLLAGLIAGAGAGLILESTGFAGASSSAAVVVIDDETSTTDTQVDRSTRLTEVLQPLVDDGTITAGQLTAIVETLDAVGPVGGGHRGGGGMGRDMGRGMGLDAAAEVLDLTADELRTELGEGQTLAEVATAQGVEVQAVIDALVTDAGTHLAEHVADGDITQAEADEKLAEMTERITTSVNDGGGFGRGGEGGRGDRGDRGDRGGHRGGPAADTGTDTDA